jgi:hypothetical protein
MIEPIMIFGIDLAASLCGQDHSAVPQPAVASPRTAEAAAPSMAELQADRDQLHAEFAMSTRQIQIEQLKAESAGQLAELGKKADAINLLKIEMHDKAAQIETLQASEAALQDHLNATSAELSARSILLQDTERALADKVSGILKLTGDLNEHALAADSQRFEITCARTQLDAHKEKSANCNQIETGKKTESDVRARLATAKREPSLRSRIRSAPRTPCCAGINETAAQLAQLTTTLEGPFSRLSHCSPPPRKIPAPWRLRTQRTAARPQGRRRNAHSANGSAGSSRAAPSRPPAHLPDLHRTSSHARAGRFDLQICRYLVELLDKLRPEQHAILLRSSLRRRPRLMADDIDAG